MTEPRVPRSSAVIVQKSMRELRERRKKKGRRRWIFGVLVLAALVWGTNAYLFRRPATAALAADPHTSGVVLAVHLRYYVDPATLIVDLRRADVADPTDLFRGLLRAIKAVDDATWIPGTVVLLRAGTPVYTISGAELSRVAYTYSVAQNPASVLVDLVGQLRLPTGDAAPPMPVTDAAGRWAAGRP
jgi:hypothetical protein